MRKRGQNYLRQKCMHPDCHEIISVLTDNGRDYVQMYEEWQRNGVYCWLHYEERKQNACNVDGGGI